MVNFEIDFNPETFALGIAAGWASAYGVYRARHTLDAIVSNVTQQAESAQNYATRSSDSRYVSELLREIETDHLGGKVASLTDLLVEPRFLPAPSFAVPVDNDEAIYSVFHVVPQAPDQPFLHAPYNVESMSINDLGNGDRAIALLGQPGSGRTTALRTIALWSLGRVTFDPPRDPVQEIIEEEYANLKSDERADKLNQRRQIEEMALQTLARSRGDEFDQDTALQRQSVIPIFQRLSPIYVHLANVNHQTGEFSRQVDPAEPLVRAVQSQVNTITAKNLPGKVYERLTAGQALILIDGYDDLPVEERPAKLAWLQAFMTEYGRNFVIITGPATGFGRLTDIGFTPVFLRPWMDTHMDIATEKWASVWSKVNGSRRRSDDVIDDKLLAHAKSHNRARSPFELTLKLWSNFEDPERASTEAQLRAVIQKHLPEKVELESILTQLVDAATLQLDAGYITVDAMEAIAFARSRNTLTEYAEVDETTKATTEKQSPEEVASALDDLDDLFTDDEGENETPADEASQGQNNQRDQPTTNIDKERARARKELQQFLTSLKRAGLIQQYVGERFQFRYSLITAYLASLSLTEANIDTLLEKSQTPAWSQTMTFAALHTPLDALVDIYLNAPADVLHSNILTAASWLKYAPPDADWRRQLLRTLGNMFVAQDQYLVIRERTAAALVTSRDRNALVIFRRAVRHPDPDVRRLACLGIGAMQAENAIEELSGLLLDEDQDVQLAAGLAMGAIGTEAALDEMVAGLTEGSEQLRKAIAEAFAAIPGQGYPILYEAINHDIMELRRAAVFGLARIKTPWALVALYQTSLEDDQWYVRSAAEQAFHEMQYGDTVSGARGYPKVDSIVWLRDWLNEQGEEAIKQNQTGEEALLYALEHGDEHVQSLSVKNIGQLGLLDYASVLYRALRHRQATVREAAYRALGDLQTQLNTPLPSPV